MFNKMFYADYAMPYDEGIIILLSKKKLKKRKEKRIEKKNYKIIKL